MTQEEGKTILKRGNSPEEFGVFRNWMKVVKDGMQGGKHSGV